MSPYLHQTQNRIRIRSEYIQRNPERVTETIAQLRQIAGVQQITHRHYAGSVAICFDSKLLSGDTLLAHIEPAGWLSVARNQTYIDRSLHRYTRSLAKGLALMTLDMAIKGPLVKRLVTLVR